MTLLLVVCWSFVVHRSLSIVVVHRSLSIVVVHRSSFIVGRRSSFVVVHRSLSIVVVHRWSSSIVGRCSSFVVVHRSSQGPGAFLQGAGPTAAGYFLGGAIAFGGTEILKRTAIAVLGPQVAIAYSFPVSQSANKSVSQSVSQSGYLLAAFWSFHWFIDS
jgi:hypothetical protein